MEDGANILSVSEYTDRIKAILEQEIPPSWIRGEISNLRRQSSGHVYFTLKDANSQLACVLFRGNAQRQAVELMDGKQIMVYGEISVYEPRGAYQVIVRLVLEDGKGKLQLAFEALKQKLAEEGLFDPEKKQELPSLPRTVGFITSPTGAAIHDFISILKRRNWHGMLVILPSKVQGEGATSEITDQIRVAEKMKVLDLLVIGRGGGSLEDLWSFNEEAVVRAVASCSIPTISAVGHEIDFTLTDFAADRRAETPSAAAEILTSGYVQFLNLLEELSQRLQTASPKNRLEKVNLRLDDFSNRLVSGLRHVVHEHRQLLHEHEVRLLGCSPKNRLELARQKVSQLTKRLRSASVESSLMRGFAMMRDPKQKVIIKQKAGLEIGQSLTAVFKDGEVEVDVTSL